MITARLQQAINDQITAEFWSSNLYLQMSYFLKQQGWDGYSHWLRKHAMEEREHATRMADYMTDRGGIVKLQMIDVVPEGWGSILELFEHSFSHEKHVSKMINTIVTLSIDEEDYATENFFRTFVDEQVEEEALFGGIVDKLKKAGLEEFCLELHSHKANKKDVITELCHTLKAQKSALSDRAQKEIEAKIRLKERKEKNYGAYIRCNLSFRT